jgi:tRNA threonylcarbamoyladenosine biosynthesis protein TsaE
MNAEFTFISESESQTARLGHVIGQLIEPGTVIALNGTLGAGKTRLVQSIAAGLGIDPETVLSPTFTLCVPHCGRLTILHVDAYRIRDTSEVDMLGLDEQVDDGSVLLVEWADRIKKALPPVSLTITIEHLSPSSRKFCFVSGDRVGLTLVSGIKASFEESAA